MKSFLIATFLFGAISAPINAQRAVWWMRVYGKTNEGASIAVDKDSIKDHTGQNDYVFRYIIVRPDDSYAINNAVVDCNDYTRYRVGDRTIKAESVATKGMVKLVCQIGEDKHFGYD